MADRRRADRSGRGEQVEDVAGVERMRAELRALPGLEPPRDLWPAIERRLVRCGIAGPPPAERTRRRLAWLSRPALRFAGIAAVLAVGIGLGRLTVPARSGDGEASSAEPAGARPAVLTVADALEEVRRRSAEYDAALRRLEVVAESTGARVPPLVQQRLAALDLLVEASRTALAVEPADPELNAYLFAALEQRDDVMREMIEGSAAGANSEVVWR